MTNSNSPALNWFKKLLKSIKNFLTYLLKVLGCVSEIVDKFVKACLHIFAALLLLNAQIYLVNMGVILPDCMSTHLDAFYIMVIPC